MSYRVLLLAVAVLAGCERYQPERPTVNLPRSLRQENWTGPRGEGSCVYASLVSAFHWQGRPDLAGRVKSYGDGSWPERLRRELDAEGVRYAMTTRGDVAFLEWACRTRRGAAVTWGYRQPGGHMLLLVHLDDEFAAIVDNNWPARVQWLPRATFINWWRRSSGWAVTPVYSPVPPPPF